MYLFISLFLSFSLYVLLKTRMFFVFKNKTKQKTCFLMWMFLFPNKRSKVKLTWDKEMCVKDGERCISTYPSEIQGEKENLSSYQEDPGFQTILYILTLSSLSPSLSLSVYISWICLSLLKFTQGQTLLRNYKITANSLEFTSSLWLKKQRGFPLPKIFRVNPVEKVSGQGQVLNLHPLLGFGVTLYITVHLNYMN